MGSVTDQLIGLGTPPQVALYLDSVIGTGGAGGVTTASLAAVDVSVLSVATDVSAVRASLSVVAADVSALRVSVAAVQTSLSNLQVSVASVATRVDNVSTSVGTLRTSLSGLNGSFSAAIASLAIVDIPFIIDNGGAVISTGIKGDVAIDWAGTITQWTLLADVTGSIAIDIWKDTFANYPPVVGDSITAGAPPTITTSIKALTAGLAGWTTAIAAGDTLRFNVNSASTITRVTLILRVTRTV